MEAYADKFFTWRDEIRSIKASGLMDAAFGWRTPFLARSGAVKSFAEVGYAPPGRSILSWQMRKCARYTWTICARTYDYLLTKGPSKAAAKLRKRYSKLYGTSPQKLRPQPSHKDCFELTEVRHAGARRSRELSVEQKARLQRAVKKAREEQENIDNQKKLAANPEKFTQYPVQPRRRYLPVPELMHELIFKAFEEHVGAMRVVELFGADEQSSLADWSGLAQQQASTGAASNNTTNNTAMQPQATNASIIREDAQPGATAAGATTLAPSAQDPSGPDPTSSIQP